MIPVALTIAGSDPSGGAGLQADLKTFHQHGVYGCSAVTLLTVQNTQGVQQVELLNSDLIDAQIRAVCEDLSPRAAKTGALGSAAVIASVAELAEEFEFPLVVDPVMISKHGHALIEESAIEVLKQRLLPRAFLVTPNVLEAERLTGVRITDMASMEVAAHGIHEMGARNVLLKSRSQWDEAADLLLTEEGELRRFVSAKIATQNTHGSGCVYSAAITAQLALGQALQAAVEKAKQFITAAIANGPGLGKGLGPVDMFAAVEA